MASNDVRRLDDTLPWWIFLWGGPLELAVMLIAVSLRISLLAALAGAGCLLLLFPLQVDPSLLVILNVVRCTPFMAQG